MGSHAERTGRIEALRELMERLCAPDLTLTEAKILRCCLTDLLEQADRDGETGQPSSSLFVLPSVGDGGPRQEAPSFEPMMPVTG